MQPLHQIFYLRDSLVVARDLLGKTLVRQVGDKHYAFKIVETEAYRGEFDKASHAYGGKLTNRTRPMFQAGGITYIYLIYGMYYCLNIVTNNESIPHAVLIRALQPLDDEAIRYAALNRPIKSKKVQDLTNGPGKLCKALVIDKTLNEVDVTEKGSLWIAESITEENNMKDFEIIEDKRINIPYAMEYQDVLWRFYINHNQFVSVLKK